MLVVVGFYWWPWTGFFALEGSRRESRCQPRRCTLYRCNDRACSNSLFRETAIRSPVVLGGCVAHLALAPTIRDFKLCFHDVTWGRACGLALQGRTRSSRFEEQPNGLRTGPRRKETAADRPLKPRITRYGNWRVATLVRGARRATRCGAAVSFFLLDSK